MNRATESEANRLQWEACAEVLREGANKWLASMLRRFPHRRETLERAHRKMLEGLAP